MGTTFKSTQLVFRNVEVKDGTLNINIIDRGVGNPPENSAIDAMAILQTPMSLGAIPPRITSIRPVERNLEIQLDPGLDYAANLSGLASFGVEQSLNLKTWAPTGKIPFTVNGKLIFEVTPSGARQFYRARLLP